MPQYSPQKENFSFNTYGKREKTGQFDEETWRDIFLHCQTLIIFYHFRQVVSFLGSFRYLESHTSIVQKLDLLIWETRLTSSQQRIQRGKVRKRRTVSSDGLDFWVLHALELDSYHASEMKALKEVWQWVQIKKKNVCRHPPHFNPPKTLGNKDRTCLLFHIMILVFKIT